MLILLGIFSMFLGGCSDLLNQIDHEIENHTTIKDVEILSFQNLTPTTTKHNAFTDIAYHNGRFYVAFREGNTHFFRRDNQDEITHIKIISSTDFKNWDKYWLLRYDNYWTDYRDPFFYKSNGKLFVGSFAVQGQGHGQEFETLTKSWFFNFIWTLDNENWTQVGNFQDNRNTIWSTLEHNGITYGFAYHAVTFHYYLSIYKTIDGKTWVEHAKNIYSESSPSETSGVFLPDGRLLLIARRDPDFPNDPYMSVMGLSTNDQHTTFKWTTLNYKLDSPKITIVGNDVLVAGRRRSGDDQLQKPLFTALHTLNVDTGFLTEKIRFQGSDDNSYPGMIYLNDQIYLTYYAGTQAGPASVYGVELSLK